MYVFIELFKLTGLALSLGYNVVSRIYNLTLGESNEFKSLDKKNNREIMLTKVLKSMRLELNKRGYLDDQLNADNEVWLEIISVIYEKINMLDDDDINTDKGNKNIKIIVNYVIKEFNL